LFNHLPGFFAAVVPDRRLAMRTSGTYNTVTDFILRPYLLPRSELRQPKRRIEEVRRGFPRMSGPDARM
jgi:hypothetical protein